MVNAYLHGQHRPTDSVYYLNAFEALNYSQSLDLGPVNPGEDLSILYVVDLMTETNNYGGQALVSFDDPVAALSFAGQSPSVPVTPVPEPATWLGIMGGLGTLAFWRRRSQPKLGR